MISYITNDSRQLAYDHYTSSLQWTQLGPDIYVSRVDSIHYVKSQSCILKFHVLTERDISTLDGLTGFQFFDYYGKVTVEGVKSIISWIDWYSPYWYVELDAHANGIGKDIWESVIHSIDYSVFAHSIDTNDICQVDSIDAVDWQSKVLFKNRVIISNINISTCKGNRNA